MSHTPAHLDGLDYSRELVERVQREADECTFRWFWRVAVLAIAVGALGSIFWPWGWAA